MPFWYRPFYMITSTANTNIKKIRKLLEKRSFRAEEKCFVAEGLRIVMETPPEMLEEIYLSESFLKDEIKRQKLEKIFSLANMRSLLTMEEAAVWQSESMNHPVLFSVLKDSIMQDISATKTPQGILAVVRMPHYSEEEILKKKAPLLLFLENIQDPGNLGTIFRTAEGAGVTGVILSRNTTDLFSPKVIRSTMGSIYRMPFYVAEDFIQTLARAKANEICLYAAHLKGKNSYDHEDYQKAAGFLIGNEGNGLTDETAGMADVRIRIPMGGKLESLNAAMAAGILMYEAARQRRNG